MKIRPLKYTEQWHLPHGCHCSYLCRKYARECLSLKNHFSQLLRENARLKLESEKNVQGHTAGKKSEQERKNIAKHSGFVGFFDFRARKNVQSENLENLAPQSIHRNVQFLVRNPEKISYRPNPELFRCFQPQRVFLHSSHWAYWAELYCYPWRRTAARVSERCRLHEQTLSP